MLVGADSVIANSGRPNPVSIGSGSIILPGSIVTKDIAPYSLVTGTNKVLMQGEQFFVPAIDIPAENRSSLAARLSSQGQMRLASIDACTEKTDLALSSNIYAVDKTYREQNASNTEARNSFFADTPPSVLDTCVIPSPVYVKGRVPELNRGMIVNMGCSFQTSPGGRIEFSEGILLAPLTSLIASNNSNIHMEPSTWCGARSQILAPQGETITIGSGSILAAGARVNASIPTMSIVIGDDGKVLRKIDERDIFAVPTQWNDMKAYQEYKLENIQAARAMTPEQRQRHIEKILG